MRKLVLPAVLALAALLAGLTSWAASVYVIVLKNGSRITAREKYEVKGPSAVFRLKNGTLTSLPLSQIDVATTEKVNKDNLGDAMALDWVDSEQPRATPTATASVAIIGHLKSEIARPGRDARPTPTPGILYRDRAFGDPQVDRTFQEALERSHLYLYRTSIGTNASYLFIEVSVNGQVEVLKALQAIALAYHLLAEQAADRVPPRVEVQLLNEAGKEAGLFRLSAEDAAQLATGTVTPEDFFIQHVIF